MVKFTSANWYPFVACPTGKAYISGLPLNARLRFPCTKLVACPPTTAPGSGLFTTTSLVPVITFPESRVNNPVASNMILPPLRVTPEL
ncbi:MAG: hypothetical protein BWY67_00131 [Bacteroidetes bacterium ADurb.Bin397]|nr:MAG: hypothetical protein BWY67_00131 [Bacteroidetes bacterium ADurb.Bin397]